MCPSVTGICSKQWHPFKLCTVWKQFYWAINWTREQNALQTVGPPRLPGTGGQSHSCCPVTSPSVADVLLAGDPPLCPISPWGLQSLPEQLSPFSTGARLVSPCGLWAPSSPAENSKGTKTHEARGSFTCQYSNALGPQVLFFNRNF